MKSTGKAYAGWLCRSCGSRWERIVNDEEVLSVDEMGGGVTVVPKAKAKVHPSKAANPVVLEPNMDSPPVCFHCNIKMMCRVSSNVLSPASTVADWEWQCRNGCPSRLPARATAANQHLFNPYLPAMPSKASKRSVEPFIDEPMSESEGILL